MNLWEKHGLTEREYQAIKEQLGREPNPLELALYGVMWSEHCSYKHTRHLLRDLPTSGPQVVQGPGENAGVIDAGDGLGLAFKLESHNHPTAVDPYQGSATGVGGIVRDVFSMGARPIALLNSLRFGPLTTARNRWLFREATKGAADYGNGLDVPTVGGEVYFEPCYDQNPLVNAMCIGLVPLDQLQRGTAAGPGNRVMVVGARTGRDGIAGAAFASAELAQDQDDQPAAGDPQAEKLLLEACLELVRLPQLVGIQDLGAAGLTSASCEMAHRGGCGLELELSRVPVREKDMEPMELLLSESQERMLVVVEPQGVAEVEQIFARRGLEAADVGVVTPGTDMVLLMEGQEVGRIPAASLADGVPRRNPAAQAKEPMPVNDAWRKLSEPDYRQTLLDLLAHPNLASRSPLWEQLDSQAGGNTVQGPGTSAAVVRIPGSKRALAAATDCNGRYCQLDPGQGTQRAVAEAARNVACTGAVPVAVTNCLNFPSPEKPQQYWQLTQAVEGMAQACRALGTPVVGGNVSLYNEGGGIAIHPTPVIGMVGLLEDGDKACTIAPQAGQTLVLLGEIQPLPGGSHYLELRTGDYNGPVPQVDLEREAALGKLLSQAIAQGKISAAHDVSDGGIAVTLAEMAMASDLGMEIQAPQGQRPDFWLFSESPGAVVTAVEQEKLPELKEMASKLGLPLSVLGQVQGEKLVVQDLFQVELELLRRSWKETLEKVFSNE